MPEPLPEDSYEALARDIAAWDGSAEAAAAFRLRLPLLPALKGKPESPEAGMLARLNGLYRKRESIGLTEALKEAGASLRAPFIGDPKMGVWPFHDALHIDDGPAEQWLAVFRARHVVDEPLRAFVRTMFEARRRELWIPAAEVLGFQATHDAASRDWLRDTWMTCFPKGIPARWPGGGILTGDAPADRHIARHVLSAACALVARGGTLDDVDPSQLATISPPTDSADASAILVALSVLILAEGQALAVSAWLEKHAANIPADPQCDEALRGLLPRLEGSAFDAVRARLMEPRWNARRDIHTLDALCSWLGTAAWFRAIGDEPAVAQMRETAGDALPALLVALDGAPGDALERVLVLLPVAMDGDVFATTRAVESRLAELLELLKAPALQDVPWRPLVSRALGASAALRAEAGTVGQRALGDLAVELTERGLYVGGLYRGRWYGEEDVLRFAARPAMATQVGVQMERQLRQCRVMPKGVSGDRGPAKPVAPESPEERQVRLLWRLLRSDPPPEAFREIGRVMRGSDTALHRLLGTVAKVDAERHGPGLWAAYRALTERAAELIEADEAGHKVGGWLTDLASSLRMPQAATVAWDPVANLDRLRALVRALANWAMWWDLPGEEIRTSWEKLERLLEPCIRPPHVASLVELDGVTQALTKLETDTSVLVWPESTLVHTEIALWRAWVSQARERANEVSTASDRVRESVERGGEPECIALMGPAVAEQQTIDALPPADITRLHKFFLHRWLFSEATALAERVGNRVQLLPVRRHLAMVFVGVATGPILVVDFGVVFNSVLLPGRTPAFVATMLLCALGTLAVLGTSVQSPPQSGGEGATANASRISGFGARIVSAVTSGRVKATRAAWVWGATYVEAMILSVLFLEILSNNLDLRTLDGVALPWLPQVLLWTGLSQFLGIFVGVIAQGKSVGGEEG